MFCAADWRFGNSWTRGVACTRVSINERASARVSRVYSGWVQISVLTVRRERCEELLASSVDLTHRALQSFRERLVVLAELRIAVGLPVGEFGLVFLPQQRQYHALAAQLLMDASAVGPGVGCRSRRLAEKPPLEFGPD